MLTKIILEHFKCFKKLHLPLAPLTLLSGRNATGKSTILQAMGILHQTAVEREWSKALILNASTVSLGTARDVIDEITSREIFKIGLHMDTSECVWTIKRDDPDSLSVPIQQVAWREAKNWKPTVIEVDDSVQIRQLLPTQLLDSSEHAREMANILMGLTYISAERIGPREIYPMGTPDLHKNVGIGGEFAPWFLYYFDTYAPLEGLVIKDVAPTLPRQAEAWMKVFFPGSGFMVTKANNANKVILGMRTSEAADFHRPQNVGYGLSHILPLLTACLAAHEKSIVMIENPEAHLHPSGQAAMGDFLARSAESGIQIILETHSDHILNGVRRAVKKGIISPEKIAIHFFTPRQTTEPEFAPVISPLVDRKGNLDQWPTDFFDQIDKDMAFLIDWES